MSNDPTPGSDEAVAAGCTCPVADNCCGAGVPCKGGTMFWYHARCPMHGAELEPLEASDG